MIFLNPQWQGSGTDDVLRIGAENLRTYFQRHFLTEVRLSAAPLAVMHGISGYLPIAEQAASFKKLILRKSPSKMGTVGGDCGIELMPVSYLNKRYNGDLAVLWIDAHADLNTPRTSPSGHFHGMVLRTLLGDGETYLKNMLFSSLKPSQVFFVGLRDLDKAESAYIARHKITKFDTCNFYRIHNALKNFSNIYIHLDLDVIDKAEFPFTLFPAANGLPVKDVVQLIFRLKNAAEVAGLCFTGSAATTIQQLDPIRMILDQIEPFPKIAV